MSVRPEPYSIGSSSPMCWLEPFSGGSKIRGLGEEHNFLHSSSPVAVPQRGLILMSLLLTCMLPLKYASSLSEEVLAPLLMESTDRPVTRAGFRINFFLFTVNPRHSRRYNIPVTQSWIKSLDSTRISI